MGRIKVSDKNSLTAISLGAGRWFISEAFLVTKFAIINKEKFDIPVNFLTFHSGAAIDALVFNFPFQSFKSDSIFEIAPTQDLCPIDSLQ